MEDKEIIELNEKVNKRVDELQQKEQELVRQIEFFKKKINKIASKFGYNIDWSKE